MSVRWNYFDKFEALNDKYLPRYGEGETKATQIVTAVCKLIYKWYNDGDVFDNTHYMEGWCNDLSSYANWLDRYTKAGYVLNKISNCYSDGDYEDLLKELADLLMQEDFLEEQNRIKKIDTIYDCDGRFRFEEDEEEYEEEEWYEDDEEDW